MPGPRINSAPAVRPGSRLAMPHLKESGDPLMTRETEQKLVPVEPTADMIAVAEQASQMLEWQIRASWSAMLAAAPSPDTGKMGGEADRLREIVRWYERDGTVRAPEKGETERLIAALSAPVSGGEGEAVALEKRVTEFVEEYEFRGDGGDYTPSEGERLLIEDALRGFISEHIEANPSDPSATERMRAEFFDGIDLAYIDITGRAPPQPFKDAAWVKRRAALGEA